MRRHLLLYRALKRRHRLARPRYSLRVLWYGGATFSMFLFILMLLSSSLMYYYFQKCKYQQRELVRWRTGIKARDEAAAAPAAPAEERGPISSAVRMMQQKVADLPASINSGLGYEMPKPSAVDAEATPSATPRAVAPDPTASERQSESDDIPAPRQPVAEPPESQPRTAPAISRESEAPETLAEKSEPKPARTIAQKPAGAERDEHRERESRPARTMSEERTQPTTRPRTETPQTRRTTAAAPREATRSGAASARMVADDTSNDPIGSLLSSRAN